jgi:hypothetical protein
MYTTTLLGRFVMSFRKQQHIRHWRRDHRHKYQPNASQVVPRCTPEPRAQCRADANAVDAGTEVDIVVVRHIAPRCHARLKRPERCRLDFDAAVVRLCCAAVVEEPEVDEAPVEHIGRHIPAPDGVHKRQVVCLYRVLPLPRGWLIGTLHHLHACRRQRTHVLLELPHRPWHPQPAWH